MEILFGTFVVFFAVYGAVQLFRQARHRSGDTGDDVESRLDDIASTIEEVRQSQEEILSRLKAAGQEPPVAIVPPPPPPPVPKPSVVPEVGEVAPVTLPPEPEPLPPPARPQAAEDVDRVLRKLWCWVLMGRSEPPTHISREAAIAQWWLMLGGGICVGLAGIYFLLLSIQNGYLGPVGRVALSLLAGVGLLVWGLRWSGKRYHLLAQAFLGLGLAFLYFGMYAAGPMYSVFSESRDVSTVVSFVFSVLITAAAGIIAVRVNSQLTAVFGIIGGFATPLMMHVSAPSLAVLYGYLLLLGLGVLGIAHVRQWRLLNYLAFAFTWAVFFAGLGSYHEQHDFALVITFLSLLFVLHSGIVYYYNLAQRRPTTALEVVHLTLNVALYGATAYRLIADACGRPWPALMAVGVALFYVAQVFLFLRGNLRDRKLLVALIGIAGTFTIWAVPLMFEKETVTIFWALLAAFFLWVGLKLRSNVLVGLSSLVYCLTLARLLVWDMPRDFADLDWSQRPMVEYLRSLLSRLLTFGLVIASFFAASRLHGRGIAPSRRLSVAGEADMRAAVSGAALRETTFWTGVGCLFLLSYLELTQLFSYWTPLQAPVLTVLWCGLAFYLLTHYHRAGRSALLVVGCVVAVVALSKLLLHDMAVWGFDAGEFACREQGLDVPMRLIGFGAVFVLLWLFYRAAAGPARLPRLNRAFKVAALGLCFLYATLETSTFCHWHLSDFRAGALSIVWALFAIGFLVRGLWASNASYRYTGLVLFAVVVVKVFLYDLAGTSVAYRVIGFLVVGALLVGGSFAYLKANRTLSARERAS